MNDIMILGAYGAFGRRIAEQLAQRGLALVLVGRNQVKLEQLQSQLSAQNPTGHFEIAAFDVHQSLAPQLTQFRPQVVIHCCGPFQGQEHHVLNTCIEAKVHYIDLADGRSFINRALSMHAAAVEAGVTAITGASTVPALSSAVLAALEAQGMVQFDEVRYGISPGQQTDRGLATARAVLSYIGRPFHQHGRKRYGWLDWYQHTYPLIGSRMMGNCDIPDTDLLPKHFPIQSIHFSAGMESRLLHVGMWLCAWLVRLGVPMRLEKNVSFWFRVSRWFDRLGTDTGGMHFLVKGRMRDGTVSKKSWYLIARSGHGPYVPTIPAVLLATRLCQKSNMPNGVMPCIKLISLNEYMDALSSLEIEHIWHQ